jgi:hypothetical protein
MKMSNLKKLNVHGNLEWVKIINKHLASGKRISKCREELIEAGLKEYAKL